MPTPRDLVGTKTDQCQCGRRASIRHCPDCGSTTSYGYAQPQIVEKQVPSGPDGEPMTVYEKVKLFRCIRCGKQYSDKEREFCGAPPVGDALQRQKAQALAEVIQAPDIPESVKSLLPQSHLSQPTSEEAWREYKKLEANIRSCYADEVYALKERGEKHHLSEAEYIDAMLIQLGKHKVSDPATQKEG